MVAFGAVVLAFVPGIVGGGRADKRMKALTAGERATGRKSRVDPAKMRQERRKSLQDILDEQSEKNKKKQEDFAQETPRSCRNDHFGKWVLA